MKCEDCCHAEMCKWIDELEGRGCDFYDGKPCKLLILKSDIFLHQDDRKKWAESIEQEKAKGLIILPPYFTPVLVPDDVEIQIEQEPCEDAISRKKAICVISACDGKSAQIESLEQLPSVTPSILKARWIKVTNGRGGHECSNCCEYAPNYKNGEEYLCRFCPDCGAEMESEE